MSSPNCCKSSCPARSGSRFASICGGSGLQGKEARKVSKIRTKSGRSDLTVSQTISVSQSKYPCVSRFRIAIRSDHGTSATPARPSGDICLAASPIISISFTRDSRSIRSFYKSSRALPFANRIASRAATSMWFKRVKSAAFILNRSRGQHFVAEIAADFPWCSQIYFSSQQIREFQLHSRQAKVSGSLAGLKLYQHVDVASGPESWCQDRSKQRQFSDVMADAKRLNLFAGKFNGQHSHHLFSASFIFRRRSRSFTSLSSANTFFGSVMSEPNKYGFATKRCPLLMRARPARTASLSAREKSTLRSRTSRQSNSSTSGSRFTTVSIGAAYQRRPQYFRPSLMSSLIERPPSVLPLRSSRIAKLCIIDALLNGEPFSQPIENSHG